MANPIVCPFCGFRGSGEYAIQLHIEEHHTEDSPWIVTNSAPDPPKAGSSRDDSSSRSSASDENPWIKCTRPDCGTYFLISDMNDHYELHEEEERLETGEKLSERSSKRPSSPTGSYATRSTRSPRKSERSQTVDSKSTNSRTHSLLEYFSGSSTIGRPPPKQRRLEEPREPGRLGRRELGPHAYEKRMPEDVRRRLIRGAEPYYSQQIGRDGRLYRGEPTIENETRGLIPVLADLCNLDRTTTVTYLCDPSVRHAVKIRCDGNFCGYWNIQMLLTYLNARRPNTANGNSHIDGNRLIPNVLEIQDTIERAWNNGICSYGRIETGGIRNTRKWIGTHEALAYFTQVGVPVEALSFREDEKESDTSNSTPSQPAVSSLLDHIEAYFISALETAQHHGTSHITALPPLYFQRFGHSMTIVGLERKADGGRNLLVFDPSFATAAPMGRLLARRKAYAAPETVLRAYRRSDVSLSRWSEFEVVVPKMAARKDGSSPAK